jgi:DNA-binding GntR family transcriptional regulator
MARWAYRELRAAPMRGELLPATTLTLRALADRLGTSVMPIREAVSRLAAEHAVEPRPNRAIRVPDSSRTEIDHLWRIRLLIESEAAALAATTAGDEQIDGLSAVCQAMWQAYRASDTRAMVEGTGRWTILLADANCSAPFIDFISNLRLRCAPLIARALAEGITRKIRSSPSRSACKIRSSTPRGRATLTARATCVSPTSAAFRLSSTAAWAGHSSAAGRYRTTPAPPPRRVRSLRARRRALRQNYR